ncbi:TonB-dependent receptor [Mucilaginibacter mali]|uniref:TonB-dependent receptor n=1 Tax=Mucilaginibacter mali TaxID=2740462 RepID=A0A7D4Q589_9SPHI|nr:TonB-dependent receptor [Mucilaginibacter mali]QKJ31587.1 TonB-dependent receptor [Mucilaginibacter mali]
MKRTLTLFFLLTLITGFAFANGIIKGTVTDKKTAEPLIGATVHIKSKKTDFKQSISTGLDGSYTFKNVPAGEYEVEAKYISYKDEDKNITLKDGDVAIVRLQLEAKGSELKEVVVGAKAAGGSDQTARRIEQRSDQVLNAVSAKTIEISPDITVANVMQRVSGVSVERSSNGEAQYPIIRGMEKRYISTLINGVKIPSPDNKNRYVPLDIFPADIIDRLEVYKSLTPSMEADAIGGAVNLVLKDAPDDFTVNANLAAGYSQIFFDRDFVSFNHSSANSSPRIMNGNDYLATNADFSNNRFKTNTSKPVSSVFGLTIGGRTADKKLGVLGALSYQNTYRGNNSVYFGTDVDRNNNEPVVSDVESRTYNIQQQRTGVHTKADYKFDSNNKIDLYAAYLNLTQNQYRLASDTDLVLGRTGMGVGRVKINQRSSRIVQQIYNTTLKGNHRITDKFRTDWSLVYSKAEANEPDRATLDISTGVLPSGQVIAPTFDALNGQQHVWAKNSDRDKAAYLNFAYTPKILSTDVEFTFGGMYRDKDRTSIYDSYSLRPVPSTQTVAPAIESNTFQIFNTQGTSDDALNYVFNEKVGAYYGQFKFNIGKVQTIGGIRTEYTRQGWQTGASQKLAGTTGHIEYYDVLPSLAFKYKISDKQNLRASYYSGISRPGFYELVPHTGGDPDADYTEIGNPNLKRVTADNYDLRYEFFPKALDQLLVGAFYKQINNPIEFAITNNTGGATGYSLQASNFGTGTNYGFELDFTKYIHNFGIRANYTYTDSKITTSKYVRYRDAGGFLTQRPEMQTRPLQGQSKNIGNVSLLYKSAKTGLDAQIALVYTGSRINSVSPYLDNDIWQKASTQLDVSVEKKLFRHFYGYVKAANLLNTPFELELHRPYNPASTVLPVEYETPGKNVFVRRDRYEQTYLIGLRFKL